MCYAVCHASALCQQHDDVDIKIAMLQTECDGLDNPDFDVNDLKDPKERLSIEWPSYKGKLLILPCARRDTMSFGLFFGPVVGFSTQVCSC